MKALYWVSAIIVLYVYAGYPLLLAAWAGLQRSRPRTSCPVVLPSVSIILAARDEGERLRARIDNLLALDYPAHLREIIIVSDGSRDNTADVLTGYGDAVKAILLPEPGGKAAALNAGVARAERDVLVFADARQRFAPDALRRLVEPLADPRIGGVSGELLLDAEPGAAPPDAGSPVAEGMGLYWRYETWLRQRESDVGSMLGATGAIYALRHERWRPLPVETLLDDVLAPMRAVLDGYRVVLAPGARAYDRSSADAETEQRRKVRTLAGNYQLLRLEPRLLVPFANPVWLQFVSHKLGRLLVPYALAALLVSNIALADAGLFYGATLALQVAFYVLAAHGAIIATAGRPSPVGSPAAAPRVPRPGPSQETAAVAPHGAQATKSGKGVGECAA